MKKTMLFGLRILQIFEIGITTLVLVKYCTIVQVSISPILKYRDDSGCLLYQRDVMLGFHGDMVH